MSLALSAGSPWLRPLGVLGRRAGDSLQSAGEIALLIGRAVSRFPRPPLPLRELLRQIMHIGVRSLALALIMGAFTGMVMAFQFGVGLKRFGAHLLIGQTTVTALVREMAPLLTALIVGGRVGAGMAAELGGMAVTEQLDAMRVLGADPLRRLVAPRILATTIALPLLAVWVMLIGFAGGMLVADGEFGVPPVRYARSALDFIQLSDFGSGLLKATVFGLLVGSIGCHFGLRARGGTEGVGRSTTSAVVTSALCVLAADFVLTRLLLSL